MKIGNITTIGQLRDTIRDLEHQNYINEQHMRARVGQVSERLKPANLIRSLLGSIFHGGGEARSSLLRMAIGIATSLIVKRVFKKGLRR
ncbi:MAG TPA: hypothetical protein VNU70_07960 [Puia sp.]|jgi:hypothetical protein|nr:hypothetical protein [Puia sp.]